MNRFHQLRRALARERVETQPEQQAEDKPANGLHTAQIGVRPDHAAQCIHCQAQRQPHHGMPAQGLQAVSLMQKKQQTSGQRCKRHQHGFERVLQHFFVRHACRRSQKHHRSQNGDGAVTARHLQG